MSPSLVPSATAPAHLTAFLVDCSPALLSVWPSIRVPLIGAILRRIPELHAPAPAHHVVPILMHTNSRRPGPSQLTLGPFVDLATAGSYIHTMVAPLAAPFLTGKDAQPNAHKSARMGHVAADGGVILEALVAALELVSSTSPQPGLGPQIVCLSATDRPAPTHFFRSPEFNPGPSVGDQESADDATEGFGCAWNMDPDLDGIGWEDLPDEFAKRGAHFSSITIRSCPRLERFYERVTKKCTSTPTHGDHGRNAHNGIFPIPDYAICLAPSLSAISSLKRSASPAPNNSTNSPSSSSPKKVKMSLPLGSTGNARSPLGQPWQGGNAAGGQEKLIRRATAGAMGQQQQQQQQQQGSGKDGQSPRLAVASTLGPQQPPSTMRASSPLPPPVGPQAVVVEPSIRRPPSATPTSSAPPPTQPPPSSSHGPPTDVPMNQEPPKVNPLDMLRKQVFAATQMVDAKLKAGEITPEQAKEHRERIQMEARKLLMDKGMLREMQAMGRLPGHQSPAMSNAASNAVQRHAVNPQQQQVNPPSQQQQQQRQQQQQQQQQRAGPSNQLQPPPQQQQAGSSPRMPPAQQAGPTQQQQQQAGQRKAAWMGMIQYYMADGPNPGMLNMVCQGVPIQSSAAEQLNNSTIPKTLVISEIVPFRPGGLELLRRHALENSIPALTIDVLTPALLAERGINPQASNFAHYQQPPNGESLYNALAQLMTNRAAVGITRFPPQGCGMVFVSNQGQSGKMSFFGLVYAKMPIPEAIFSMNQQQQTQAPQQQGRPLTPSRQQPPQQQPQQQLTPAQFQAFLHHQRMAQLASLGQAHSGQNANQQAMQATSSAPGQMSGMPVQAPISMSMAAPPNFDPNAFAALANMNFMPPGGGQQGQGQGQTSMPGMGMSMPASMGIPGMGMGGMQMPIGGMGFPMPQGMPQQQQQQQGQQGFALGGLGGNAPPANYASLLQNMGMTR